MKSYTVTDFSITSVLILKRDQNPKLRTTLRPIDVTSEIGQWYAIQITSFAGSHWTEHCVGKISLRDAPSSDDSDVPPPRVNLPRHVPQAYWYDVLENVGLKYGPAFQGLNGISTALKDHDAVATLSPFGDLTKYILHPVTIEQCLQILMVAACRGQGKSLTGLPVVTAVPEQAEALCSELEVVSAGGPPSAREGHTSSSPSWGCRICHSVCAQGEHVQGCCLTSEE